MEDSVPQNATFPRMNGKILKVFLMRTFPDCRNTWNLSPTSSSNWPGKGDSTQHEEIFQKWFSCFREIRYYC